MRSLRFATAILALALVAAACSDDGEGDGELVGEVTTTTESTAPTTTQPRVTTPTTTPVEEPPTTTVVEVITTTSTTEPPEAGTSLGPPPPPSDVRCQAGNAANELLVSFDALPVPADIAKIRVYVSVDGGPMITNGEFTIGEIDASGDRWSAPARRLPANVPLRLTATSFNQLGQESGWYIVEGLYAGQGAPCGDPAVVLPPPICTAGCDEQEGEPGA